MALQDLLNLTNAKGNKKIGISEERIEAIKPVARQYIAFWREYPDLFVDFMQRLLSISSFISVFFCVL